MHPRAVGVKDPHDADVDAVAAVIIHKQRFGDAFAFVVTRADADRIDTAAVRFDLRMHLRIAVHL